MKEKVMLSAGANSFAFPLREELRLALVENAENLLKIDETSLGNLLLYVFKSPMKAAGALNPEEPLFCARCHHPVQQKKPVTLHIGEKVNIGFKIDADLYYFLSQNQEEPLLDSVDMMTAQLDTIFLYGSSEINKILENMDSVFRSLLPACVRTSSLKQINYAETIAATLKLSLPAKARISMTACKDFIDENKDNFFKAQAQGKIDMKRAKNTARGIVAEFMISKGMSLNDVCVKMKVKKESTVQKYLCDLDDYFKNLEIKDQEDMDEQLVLVSQALEYLFPDQKAYVIGHFQDRLSSVFG